MAKAMMIQKGNPNGGATFSCSEHGIKKRPVEDCIPCWRLFERRLTILDMKRFIKGQQL